MREWKQFLSGLEQELGPEIVAEWLHPLRIVRFDAANLYLEAQNTFQSNWFEEHIRPRLKGLVNNNQRPIKVHLIAPSKNSPEKKETAPRLHLSPTAIDPEMTLENFLPSQESLMPFKLLTDPTFNPIFLYGPKGSGKTHLLMGAAAHLQKKGKRVFFVRAETFTEHVVQAIRLGFMQEFRKVYRDIDALIIDDIHIFSRKIATQEEFFHTFNSLHTLGRLILISANVSPSQLSEIEPRLISRFEWGIALKLPAPDLPLILEKKASLWKVSLPPALTQFLLEKFPRDPITALQALILRTRGKFPLTPELATQFLPDLLIHEQKNALTPESIAKSLAAHFGIRSEDLLGKSQTKECALPRQLAMYLCRERLKLPYQKIAAFFGRDHSTVMSSVKQIQKGIEEKAPDLLEALSKI
ncbi:MAG TPA: DnaA/Hda family protein, partial [Chlamydiales bacterium]|nr:DnaA/Hda family protein [Chlamydiales bacterium]